MKLKKVARITLTLLMAGIFIVLASPLPLIAQTNSTTTVYLDPPTITGITIGEEFTVNLKIRDAHDVRAWQAGLTFNPELLECTGFFEGEFLKNAGPTFWIAGTINNTAGELIPYGCTFRGNYTANGDGRLAYLTFKVKAPGVSDLHLRDVKLMKVVDSIQIEVPVNIIDVYTVVVDTTHYTVATVSNSTGATAAYGSGFYDHAFSLLDKEISFKVTGPHLGFSNVTIPKALLKGEPWTVLIDDILVIGTFTENATHTSIYFTYTLGIHKVQIFGTHAPPPPVGGKAIPIDKPIIKPKLETPWIWLLTIILPLVATVAFVKLKKKKQ